MLALARLGLQTVLADAFRGESARVGISSLIFLHNVQLRLRLVLNDLLIGYKILVMLIQASGDKSDS